MENKKDEEGNALQAVWPSGNACKNALQAWLSGNVCKNALSTTWKLWRKKRAVLFYQMKKAGSLAKTLFSRFSLKLQTVCISEPFTGCSKNTQNLTNKGLFEHPAAFFSCNFYHPIFNARHQHLYKSLFIISFFFTKQNTRHCMIFVL